MFRKFQEKLRYLIDQAFARQFVGQTLLFLTLVVFVTLVGMTAIFFGLFSNENATIETIPRDIDAGALDSLWWSLTQVLRLPGFAQTYGATFPIVLYSLFLSLMGLVVFSILISLINNTIRSRIEALRKGDTQVLECNHILLLGWNNKVFSILHQLGQLQPGIKVVILAPQDIDFMQEELRIAGIRRLPIKVILRTGIPSNHGELDRVAIDCAAGVIVLATGADDSEVIKTAVLLASRQEWAGTPPILTSEIAKHENFELANIAVRKRIHVISSSHLISKVIVQTVRNPGLSDVYSEIFSPDGNSIFEMYIPDCTDRSLADIAYKLTDAIPLGITWDAAQPGTGENRHAVGLNPEPDYEIAEDERLVLLARSSTISHEKSEETPASSIYHDSQSIVPHVPASVLLIGWTDNLYNILKELDAHSFSGTEVTILARPATDTDTVENPRELIEKRITGFKNLSVTILTGDAVMRSTWEDLDISSFKSIVVLADQSDENEDADTRTLRILLRLSDLRENTNNSIHTVAEILDSANRPLFAGLGVNDIVLSSDIISAQLAQITRKDVLAPIYRELLSVGGVEISLRPVGDYVSLDNDCTFADLIYAGQQRMEIALGLRLSAEDGKVLLNPSRHLSWQLTEDDKIIVLAQQIYQ